MKIQVTVDVDVTRLDRDGNDLPDPPPEGAATEDEVIRSVRAAVYNSVKHGCGSEADGFDHDLEVETSIIVTSVVARLKPATTIDYSKVEAALREFVGDIESTGGLARRRRQEQEGPIANQSWTDLGITYKNACKALGLEPVYDPDCGDPPR